jgi:hypothetical protein
MQNSECNDMEYNYPLNSYISNTTETSYNLCDYYIKSAYNACSSGEYHNGVVSLCALKSVIRDGVRCLDMEIYSIDGKPAISSSIVDDFFIKGTYNHIWFSDVMETIKTCAFASGLCPNFNDPLILHLRIKSENENIINQMVGIFKGMDDYMLGKEYSYETNNKNISQLPLSEFMNKIILVIDKQTNRVFQQNAEFKEYVNLTSNSTFMRTYAYENVKNNPSMDELTDYNRRNLTIVLPDNAGNSDPPNPSGIVCRHMGCQMTAMRYQLIDDGMYDNTEFYNRHNGAFVLKEEGLRGKVVEVEIPKPPDPTLSYKTREIKTDFYQFKI